MQEVMKVSQKLSNEEIKLIQSTLQGASEWLFDTGW